MKIFLVTVGIVCVTSKASINPPRTVLPQEIFRDDVEPAKGGKVPEAAHLRVELNLDMIDSTGLRDPQGIRMEQLMAAESPELLDHMLQETNSQYHPGLTPVLKLKPGYAPDPTYAPPPAAPVPAYNTLPSSGPPASAPAPYTPPAPAPYTAPAPIGPVLLDKKPNEVKSIQPLPITVTETYTNFDCRSKPHPGRHYADIETGCEVYHFCHEDGKQDTFQCGYGTVFNEYIGTCDFTSSVKCTSGEGFAPQPAPYAAPAPYIAPASHAAPAPYIAPTYHAAPAPYIAPAPYVAPINYQQPTTYHQTPGSALKPFTNF